VSARPASAALAVQMQHNTWWQGGNEIVL